MAAGPLFADEDAPVALAPGAVILPGFARAEAGALIAAIMTLAEAAPFRIMTTPGGGVMSAAMTNAGPLGWVTDRSGYRYAAHDPLTGRPWPALPARIRDLATRAAGAAGFPGFAPDACLINRYEAGAKMGLHQDRDEAELDHPIVSVSLGLPAVFLWAGATRAGRPVRATLDHGDVVVWGGPARLAYHGIAPVAAGTHPDTGPYRYNITLRRAG